MKVDVHQGMPSSQNKSTLTGWFCRMFPNLLKLYSLAEEQTKIEVFHYSPKIFPSTVLKSTAIQIWHVITGYKTFKSLWLLALLTSSKRIYKVIYILIKEQKTKSLFIGWIYIRFIMNAVYDNSISVYLPVRPTWKSWSMVTLVKKQNQ